MVVVIIFYKFKVPTVSYFYLPTHDTQIPVLVEEHNFKYIKGNVVCIVFFIFDLFTVIHILLTNWYNIFRAFIIDLAVYI